MGKPRSRADICGSSAIRSRDEAALVDALVAGTLGGVALDVTSVEPLPSDSPVWSAPRMIVTPHAAATSDPNHLVAPMLEQMDAFERGEPLRNLVDRQAGY